MSTEAELVYYYTPCTITSTLGQSLNNATMTTSLSSIVGALPLPSAALDLAQTDLDGVLDVQTRSRHVAVVNLCFT